jgi:carboxymethylenebutenolidase
VLFYGSGHDTFAQARAAYLGHFAEHDPYEPPANAQALEAALNQAGRRVTVHLYAGVGHWFFEPDQAAYNEAAARLAWDRTLAFLRSSPETRHAD